MGISSQGSGVQIQCESPGRILGKQHMWRLNYLHTKKSAMVDGNNYLSSFMDRWPLKLD